MPLRTPLAGEICDRSSTLATDGRLLSQAPYQTWLLELRVGEELDRELRCLLPAPAQRARAELDARRFRRHVGMHLLAGSEGVGPTLADGGTPLGDLARMVGFRRYHSVVCELLS